MQALLPSMLAMMTKRGWLAREANQHVLLLVEDGLHPEQALLGTGLLSRDRYAEALSDASGLPFVDGVAPLAWKKVIEDDALLETLTRFKALLLGAEDKALAVGFADPVEERVQAIRAALEKMGFTLDAFCVLEADWRLASPQTKASFGSFTQALHRLMQLVQRSTGSSFTLFEGPDGIYGISKPYPVLLEASKVTSFPWTRLARAIEQRLDPLGWSVDQRLAQSPRGLVFRRHESNQHAHPTEWPSSLQDFLRQPQGVVVFVSPDEAIRQKFTFPFDRLNLDQAAYQSLEPGWIEPRREHEQEEIIHLALMGKPIIIFAEDADWLANLQGSRIPVSIVKGLQTPHGRAWDVRSL